MTNHLFDPPDPHPAIALYRTWDTVLNASPRKNKDRCAFGRFAWALERIDDTTIGYGQQWGENGNILSHWMIDEDGRFKWGKMWGQLRRARIAEVVPFLAFGHDFSRYQWAVDFESDYLGWQGLRKWDEPRHYVSEDVLGARTWRQVERWCELKTIDGEWRIRPSHNQNGPFSNVVTDPDLLKTWERYERLIERRYRRLEAEYRVEKGLAPLVSPRTPTVRVDGKNLPTDQSVHRLLALLEADAPAKTTRLTRPKEATNGTDHLAPAHQL